MNTIAERVHSINNRIHTAIEKSRWPDRDVELIAVSKHFDVNAIREAAQAGIRIFGESYLQEAKTKIEELFNLHVEWHFIGHLQRNKAKYAVWLFDMIQSVDSLFLAEEINKHARNLGKLQDILVQVNVADEVQKSGISKEDLPVLLVQLSNLPYIKVKGLMTIPPICATQEEVLPYFHTLRNLADQMHALHIPKISTAELSMGMSNDFEAAILEGSSMVRIGSAIFGNRE